MSLVNYAINKDELIIRGELEYHEKPNKELWKNLETFINGSDKFKVEFQSNSRTKVKFINIILIKIKGD